MTCYTVLDERGNWHVPSMDAAAKRGYDVKRITRGEQAAGRSGLGFIRPHAIPTILQRNHLDYVQMAEHLTMVQDFAQVEVYDDKTAQFYRWAKWMPRTWRFDSLERALSLARGWPIAGEWIVSKADVGASSKNVRVLKSRKELIDHIRAAFGRGIKVDHCAGGRAGEQAFSTQRGYVLLQEYIPHEITWRVNAIGRGRAIFERHNYPGGHVAETGNTLPVKGPLTSFCESLLAYANEIFAAIDTRWCALDILERDGKFYLLETSLGWPWPSPGDCMAAQFYGDIKVQRSWAEMWDLMFDEYEAGTWPSRSTIFA